MFHMLQGVFFISHPGTALGKSLCWPSGIVCWCLFLKLVIPTGFLARYMQWKYQCGNSVVMFVWHWASTKISQQAGHNVLTQLSNVLTPAPPSAHLLPNIQAQPSKPLFFWLLWIFFGFVCQSSMAGCIWIVPSADVNCLYNIPAALLGKQNM